MARSTAQPGSRGGALGTYRSIVVGTDGSASAGRALRRALDLARESGAKLHVVTAIEPMSAASITRAMEAVPREQRPMVNLQQAADTILERAVADASADAVDVETHPMAADPA